MLRLIDNSGPAGIPLTLVTIRDHMAGVAREMGKPTSFCFFTNFIEQFNAAVFLEGRHVVLLLDNARNHRTNCLPSTWETQLVHVQDLYGLVDDPEFELQGDIYDVGLLILRLNFVMGAMPAAEFVSVDDAQPTCADPGEDPLALEPPTADPVSAWDKPIPAYVWSDLDPMSREEQRLARAACEMIGSARATNITPHDLLAEQARLTAGVSSRDPLWAA
ncbi:unnamed protein product [Closterium sp. Naga37s-1]|nr:unnamed protein product [Closterium sp. Naga37s-1]